MEIHPVPLDQIARGHDGREYLVTGEAGRIAARLQELDATLVCYFNEDGNYFTVAQRIPWGDRTRDVPVHRVSVDEWDDRVIHEFEVRAHEVRNGISAAARLDALDAQLKAEMESEADETIGAMAYPLMRAIQRDLGTGNARVFIPGKKPAKAA